MNIDTALPENYTLQTPMSYTKMAPFQAPFYWNGCSLYQLSTEMKDGKPELLPKWKGRMVREGVIIALAGLILASPYFMKSSHTLGFLTWNSVRLVAALGTTATVAYREMSTDISCMLTTSALTSSFINQKLLEIIPPKDLEYTRLISSRNNITWYVSSLTEEAKADPKVIAYAVFGLLNNPSFNEETIDEFINSGLDMSYFFQAFPYLFSEVYEEGIVDVVEGPDFKSEIDSNPQFKKCKNLDLNLEVLSKSLSQFFLKTDIESKLRNIFAAVLRDKKVSFKLDGLVTSDSNSRPFSTPSTERVLILLRVLHSTLIKRRLSMKNDDGTLSPGISEGFYTCALSEVGASDYSISYSKFLETFKSDSEE